MAARAEMVFRDPRAICENLRHDLIVKKQDYEKQIEILQRLVGLMEESIKDVEERIKQLNK